MTALTQIDFYKADHRRQYPEGTTLVFSNLTPRSNKLSNLPYDNDKIVFFGLQYFIKDFLINEYNKTFFEVPKEEAVAKYKRRMDNSLGPDTIPMDHIEALHDLGYLPLVIYAVPEGTKVSMGVPCLVVYNTHPDFFWLVNYIESVMSAELWKPCVSATTANWYRKLLDKYAKKTASSSDFVPFQGHDFSFRGMSGRRDAALSGAAHLLSFVGTDTVGAIDFLEDYYLADCEKELIGCSVPATEHSVMCMGSQEGEFQTFERLVKEVYPSGIVSIVSDTWDFWKVLTDYLPRLKDDIMNRDGKVVIRPDSGDPVRIICGYQEGEFKVREDNNTIWDVTKGNTFEAEQISEVEVKGAIELLWETFGGTVNDKGYKELDPHIGLIYGDSITPERAEEILKGLEAKGFASTNVVFGIGSYTYQHVTRDTVGFAVKATYGEVEGKPRVIYKNPVTDSGTKKSARGVLNVLNGELKKINGLCLEDSSFDAEYRTRMLVDGSDFRLAFRDGKCMANSLETLRRNLSNSK